ncbi:MAG TPA: nucleotide exchange factor GrpE [Tepidisphaeraceae bacterium]|jgi:molecular chaperone GrpE
MESAKKTSGKHGAVHPLGKGMPPPEGIAQSDPLHAAGTDARVLALEAQVQEMALQLSKLTDLAARAQADLQNAKARMQKDSDDTRRYAAENIIKKLLPVVDNFQRAFAHLPADLQNQEWVKGVLAIEQDLLRQLQEMGLKKMEVLGRQSDSARHEVLMVGPGEEGTVTEVFEQGYELHGKVLRPAKVKVGDGSKQ